MLHCGEQFVPDFIALESRLRVVISNIDICETRHHPYTLYL